MKTLLALLLLASSAWAQSTDQPIVDDFKFSGLKRVDNDVVVRVLKSKKGEPLEPARVTEDVRAIFSTNLFRDVVVKKLKSPDRPGHVILIYEVAEKPSIRSVNVEGNDDVSKEDIMKVVDVKNGTILNVDALAKNVGKIRDLYIDKGFYLAEVRYQVTPADKDVEVSFVVSENQKVMVKKITFLGNKHVTDAVLKEQMSTREGNLLSFVTSTGTYKEEAFQSDLFRLTGVYYDHGYIYSKVLKPQVQISGDRSAIYITVPIEEGEQFFVGKISYSGDLELKDEAGNILVRPSDVADRITMKPGEVFNRSKLFADLQKAADLYRDQGYAYANVTPNTGVNAEKKTVDVGLEVEKGEKVYFDKIEITGNTKTRDKVIRRELRIYEGELFSSTAMEVSKLRVNALGYFETVNISTERGSAPNKMNVKVEIKEKSTGTFQVGAGFSSVEKFIATAQVSQQNFLGRGESIALQAQLSFGDYGRQILTFNFVEPYFMDTMWSMNLNAYATQQLFKDFQRQRTGASLGFGYPLNSSGTLRAFLTYTGEYVQSGVFNNVFNINSSTTATRNVAGLNIKGFVSSIRADLQYDTRDNRIFPTRGNFDVASIEWADKYIGAAYDFVRLTGNLRYYYALPLGAVFKVNAQVGYIASRDPEGVPISERFFLGGIYSIRGFYPREIGPYQRVPNSGGDPSSVSSIFVFGGDKQLQVNAEVEFPIVQAAGIRGVLFCDFGNAWNDNENFFYAGRANNLIPDVYALGSNKPIKPPLGMVYSVGFGVRWFSPIGPLRFEWGIPLTKVQPSDDNLVFEFTIGNFF